MWYYTNTTAVCSLVPLFILIRLYFTMHALFMRGVLQRFYKRMRHAGAD